MVDMMPYALCKAIEILLPRYLGMLFGGGEICPAESDAVNVFAPVRVRARAGACSCTEDGVVQLQDKVTNNPRLGRFLFSMASVTQIDQFGGHESERDSSLQLDIPIHSRGGPAQLQVLLAVRASLPTNKFKCPVSLR
jgi:hypothetical protein